MTSASISKRLSDGLLVTSLSSGGRYAANDDDLTMGATRKIGTVSTVFSIQLWHYLMCYTNMSIVHVMMKNRNYGMLHKERVMTQDCRLWKDAKHTTRTCGGNIITKGRTLTICVDSCGSMIKTFYGGNKYFLVMKTSEENYVIVHFRRSRGNVIEYFRSYVNWLVTSL